MDKNEGQLYELKLYPLENEEYIGTIKIDAIVEPVKKPDDSEVSKSVQTVILLDRSGSMGDAARRVSNEIIPLFLTKLLYKKTDVLHFITFESNTKLYTMTIEGMKSLAIRAAGGTKMALAVTKCLTLFESLDCDKPVRVLTISDGKVGDQPETERAATALVDFLRNRDFSINSQAVRLFTSASQPDTKALCSLLQINNTTTSKLADISTTETNEAIAVKMADLFRSDNLSSGQSLTTDSKVFLKFPWESAAASQLTLVPGDNLFWLKGAPSDDIKIGDSPIKISMQSPLTLLKFQALMEEKLSYIVDHMKILKVVGTEEANKTVKKMVEYFEQKETSLAQKSPLARFFNIDSIHRKKISSLLLVIAEDENVTKLDSAEKADYLRKVGYNKETPSWIEQAADMGIDIDNLASKEIFLFCFIVFLALVVMKLMGK